MPAELNDLQNSMLPILWGAFRLPDDAGPPWSDLRDAEAALAAGDTRGAAAAARRVLAAEPESMVAIRAARLIRRAGAAVGPAAPPAPLGVLLVVPLDDWLDVLAVYADGAVRYYNGSLDGGGTVIDGQPLSGAAASLFDAAVAAVSRAPVQEVADPVVDPAHPTATLFSADGERLALLDSIDGGDAVMAAGAALLGELLRVRDQS